MKYILTALFFVALPTAALSPPVLTGTASVIDGATLEINGYRIRLQGIDAPEIRQLCQDGAGKEYRCGQKASQALSGKIKKKRVTCYPEDIDDAKESVGLCMLGDTDLSTWMVQQGHALADRQFGMDRYGPQEEIAKAKKRGMWQGSFAEPWEWRKQQEEKK